MHHPLWVVVVVYRILKRFLRLRLYQTWDKSFYAPPPLGGGGGGVQNDSIRHLVLQSIQALAGYFVITVIITTMSITIITTITNITTITINNIILL